MERTWAMQTRSAVVGDVGNTSTVALVMVIALPAGLPAGLPVGANGAG